MLGLPSVEPAHFGAVAGMSLRRYLLSAGLLGAVIFLAGSAAALLAARYVAQSESVLIEHRFEVEAHERVELARRTMDDRRRVVGVLQAFFAGSESVEPDEFETFTRPLIAYHPSVVALGWAVRVPGDQRAAYEQRQSTRLGREYRIRETDARGALVPAGDREEYFPLVLAQSGAGGSEFLGYDVAGKPRCREALLRAERTGATSVTGCQLERPDGSSEGVMLIVVPGGTHLGSGPPPAQPTEFAIGIFSLDILLEQVVGFKDPEAMDVEVFAGPTAEGELVGRWLVARGKEPGAAPSSSGRSKPLEYVGGFALGDSKWSVRCRATASPVWSPRAVPPILVGAGGVGLSALAAGYLLLLLHGKQRAERLAIDRAAQLQTITNAALDAVVMMDPEGRVAHWNPAAERLFGYARDEVMGRDVHELVMPERYRAKAREAIRRFGETGRGSVVGKVVEIEAKRRDGSEFPIEISVAAVWLRRRWWAVGVIRDISARRQAEQALRREQQLLRELLNLQERDRKLIAYEIHDGLTQWLSGAMMQLQSLLEEPDKNAPESKAVLEQSIKLLGEATQEARRLIAGLRPPLLDEEGVVAAIEDLVLQHENRSGQNVDLRIDVRFDRLAPPLEAAVYRIIQECLTNSARHSHSPDVCVEMAQDDGRLRIRVEDRGAGFDLATVPKERFGVRGILERARLFGGSAEIDAAPGRGTRVTVELPLVES